MDLSQPIGPICEGYNADFVPTVAYVTQGQKAFFFVGDRSINEAVEDRTKGLTVVESLNELELDEKRDVDGHTVKHVKDGQFWVEGVYQKSDTPNHNKRQYARKIWERIIADPNSSFMQTVKARGAIGHLEHPSDGRTDGTKGAIFHESFKLLPNGDVWGRSQLLDTPHGLILQEYTKKGIRWGVSSRGNGSVDARGNVNESDFNLETFDSVMRPSTPGAYPSAPKPGKVMEKIEESEKETLADWEKRTGHKVEMHTSGEQSMRPGTKHKVVVLDVGGKHEAHRRDLFHLKDYRVSTVSGPTHWMQPKTEESDSLSESVPALSYWEANEGPWGTNYEHDTPKGKYHIVHTSTGKHQLLFGYTPRYAGEKIGFYHSPERAVKAARDHFGGDRSMEESQEETMDAEVMECVQAVETLCNETINPLDESQMSDMASGLLSNLSDVNSFGKTGRLPEGKAAELKDWLTNKLLDIYNRVPETVASKTAKIEESQQKATPAQQAAFTRIVNSLQAKLEEANEEIERLQHSHREQSDKADNAEQRLADSIMEKDEAVERWVDASEKLTETNRQLTTAQTYIQNIGESQKEDNVKTALDEAITANPNLAKHRSLLERAETVEEVKAFVADFNKQSEARPRLATPRPMPRGGSLISESVRSNRAANTTSSAGANTAAQVLSKMQAPVAPT